MYKPKTFITTKQALRARAAEIETELKRELGLTGGKHATGPRKAYPKGKKGLDQFYREYNELLLNHPLAIEYRSIVRAIWSMGAYVPRLARFTNAYDNPRTAGKIKQFHIYCKANNPQGAKETISDIEKTINDPHYHYPAYAR